MVEKLKNNLAMINEGPLSFFVMTIADDYFRYFETLLWLNNGAVPGADSFYIYGCLAIFE